MGYGSEGWLLLKRDFGTPNRHIPLPYFILYNKYQGIVRIFVYTRMGTEYEHGSIRLSGINTYEQTVALTNLTNITWGSDDLAKVKDNVSASATPVTNGSWAFSDFPITYDRTISTKTNARVNFEVWGLQNYNIAIDGLGSISQVFGSGQPGNVALPGFFSPGGELSVLGKSVQGTYDTWTKWQESIKKMGASIPEGTTSKSLKNIKNWITNSGSWAVGNLGLIGAGVGLVDFLITGGRKTNLEQPAPMNFAMNFKLTGTMKTQSQISPGVTLPLPGATHTVPTSTNLLYNKPLGTLHLQNSPVLEHRNCLYNTLQTHSYRVRDELKFDLNPDSDLELVKIEAALVFELTSPGWSQSFLSYADGTGFSPIDNNKIELESFNNSKYVFRTPYIDAHTFKYQSITLPDGFNLYIKIKAELRVKNSQPSQQPVIYIATYDANVVENSGTQIWPSNPYFIEITREHEFGTPIVMERTYGYLGQNIQVTPLDYSNGQKFALWSDGERNLTRTFNKETRIKAIYKNPNYSNNAVTYSNASKRFLRAPESPRGNLFNCYESMNRVWLEKSTNNGMSWQILKVYGSDENPAKRPRLDYTSQGGKLYLYLAFISDYGTSNRYSQDIIIDDINDSFVCLGDPIGMKPLQDKKIENFSVSWNGNNDFLFVSKLLSTTGVPENMYYSLAKMKLTSNDFSFEPIQSGDLGSSKATNYSISSTKYSDHSVFHVVWEEENKIMYSNIRYENGTATISTPTEISSGSGYTINKCPSIIAINNQPKAVWIGERTYYIHDEEYPNVNTETLIESKVVEKNDLAIQTVNSFGNNVSSPCINCATDGYFAFVWSENNGEKIKFVDNSLTQIRTLNTKGKDILLSNGINKFSMFAESYDYVTPFRFYTSNSLSAHYGIVPINNDDRMIIGREGVIAVEKAQFYFGLGNVTLDEEIVKYVNVPEQTNYSSCTELNDYLMTEPFHISEGNKLNYTVKYGLTDSLEAALLLTNNKYISFTLYLMDADTDELLLPLDNALFQEGNFFQYSNYDYLIDLTPFGDRMVRLKMVLDNNFDATYTLNGGCSENEPISLGKRKVKNINIFNNEYSLNQNYPNPFNPNTLINYQVPKSGMVTLKVFDILGSEVITLVNDFKQVGRYTVEFNAKSLASGIYFYKINAGEFTQTKKMLLIK